LWQISKQLEQLTNVTAVASANNASNYKVFTALLTQDGGNQPFSLNDSNLAIGRTYFINDNDNNTADFTNVGAPNNNLGTSFIATGTIPNSWGITFGGELQFNLGAPEATVLENTIGNLWFTYNTIGEYVINSDGLFTTRKTIVMQDQQGNKNNIDNKYFIRAVNSDVNTTIIATNAVNDDGIDSVLLNTVIEIRVYN